MMCGMHKVFNFSIILKGLNGVLEIIFGLVTVFVSHDILVYWVDVLTRKELVQGPGDMIAQYLISASQHYSPETQIFIAAYLLSHGVIKVFLVFALLQKKLWAYPTAMVVFSFFLVFQFYKYINNPQFSLLILSVLDIIVVALTYFEYQTVKKSISKNT